MARLPLPLRLPPGMQFLRSDEELLNSYIRNKILCQPLPCDIIVDENVHGHHPKYLSGDGSRPSRIWSAGQGRWKATGGMQIVLNSNNDIIGLKQNFEYIERSPSSEEKKTTWLMQQHSMPQLRRGHGAGPVTASMLAEWVICKIYLTPEAQESDSDS